MMHFQRMRTFGVLAAVVALLAACGGSEDQDSPSSQSTPTNIAPASGAAQSVALESRDNNAPRAEPEAPRRFAYLRYRIDTSQRSPRACLVFSKALNASLDYGPYVRVSRSSLPALSVEGDALCLGGLEFGSQAAVSVLAGLPSADGDELAADESVTLEFADRPAFVGFAGDGVILPRKDADGLAIETVNVDTLKIEVNRVNDRALAFRRIVAGYSAGAREYERLYGDESPSGVGSLMWSGEMDVESERNAPATTVFPLAETIGAAEPGAYVISVREKTDNDRDYGVARAERWIVITDVALTAYRGKTGLSVVARSLDTARPLADTRVDLVARSNEVLASGETDDSGLISFDPAILRGEGPDAPRLALAYGPEGDFAVLDLERAPVDLSSQPVGGRYGGGAIEGYLYFDRGIYRPGETVRATALLRDGEARAVDDRAGTITVYAPNGLEAQVERFDGAPEAGAVRLDYEISTNAARGQWRMEVAIDGIGPVAYGGFAVEDFVPQRVALELEGDVDTPLEAGDVAQVDADVRFLYGAPGAGLTVEGAGRIEVDYQPFEDLEDFSFGLHDQGYSATRIEAADAVADGQGRATLVFDPENEGVDSMRPLSLRLVVSALEPGGRPVSENIRFAYRPRDRYLGLKVGDAGTKVDTPLSFDAVLVDAQGEGRPGRADWTLVRVDVDYDWFRQSNGQWQWRRSERTVPIQSGETEFSAQGRAQITTQPLDYGRYELRFNSGNGGAQASLSFYASWWGDPSRQGGIDAPDQVQVVGPSDPVNVGDTVEFRLDAPYAGFAEVVLASDEVLERRTLRLPENGATVSFTASEDWGAGAYVMASVYTPRDPVAEPRPRRAVGVAHAPIDVSARTFSMEVDAPEVARPREQMTLTLTAEGPIDENAYVTLAAVDEGILRLTKFESPKPSEFFFGKRALAVDLFDDYGRVLDPNQGAAAEVRSGGDSLGGPGLSVVPTKTVALFEGPVAFNRRGEAEITFDLPDFNGQLRLMAVAWSATGVGEMSEPLIIRDPVAVDMVLPRFLAPGDEAFATLSLDNVEGEAGDYRARIEADSPLDVTKSGALEVQLGQGERVDRSVSLAAADSEGVAEITVDASGPRRFSVEHAYPIQVRSAFLPVSVVDRGRLEPGERYDPPADSLMSFAPGSVEVSVSFSAFPIDAGALYESLSRYPYGCSEQIVSRAMPLVYAGQAAALAQRDDDGESVRLVQDAVESLLARQSSDGAFGLWRVGDRNASPWLGAYITDFLYRAKQAGAPVPDAALEQAYAALSPLAEGEPYRAYGYDTARNWDDDEAPWWFGDTYDRRMARAKAYAAYVLARAGRMDVSRLRYIHDEEMEVLRSPLARAQIGAALAFMGDQARAVSAFDGAEDRIGYTNRGNYYQSATRDLAGITALAAEAGETELTTRLTEQLAQTAVEPERLTTQEKAFLLMALNSVTGGEQVRINARGADEDRTGQYSLTGEQLSEGASFTNRGNAAVWRTTIVRGAPTTPPDAVAEGVSVSKTVWDLDGATANLSDVRQGDQFIVEIALRPRNRRLAPMIVADLLPAGFEIEATLSPDDVREGPFAWVGELARLKASEERDDRFVAALDLRGEPATIAYMVRAVTPGVFTAPGAVAENMYKPDEFGRSASSTITIAQAG